MRDAKRLGITAQIGRLYGHPALLVNRVGLRIHAEPDRACIARNVTGGFAGLNQAGSKSGIRRFWRL